MSNGTVIYKNRDGTADLVETIRPDGSYAYTARLIALNGARVEFGCTSHGAGSAFILAYDEHTI